MMIDQERQTRVFICQVAAERASAHHHRVSPASIHSYYSSTCATHPTYIISDIELVTPSLTTNQEKRTQIQLVQSRTSSLYHYPDRDKPLAVVRYDDDDDERHVHVGLANGGGDGGDEVVPDAMEAARNPASDQGHPLSDPLRFFESHHVMTFLPLLPDSGVRLNPSMGRRQHKNLEGCTRGAGNQTSYFPFQSLDQEKILDYSR